LEFECQIVKVVLECKVTGVRMEAKKLFTRSNSICLKKMRVLKMKRKCVIIIKTICELKMKKLYN
jgi:hypothetical protein